MKRLLLILFLFSIFAGLTPELSKAQPSFAKEWNEELLNAIRNSKARPTVHARNLYHWSILAYDCWAAYEKDEEPFFLGKTLEGYYCPFEGVPEPKAKKAAQKEAIAFASYRLLKHRYQVSPGYAMILNDLKSFMSKHGYNIDDTSTHYVKGDPAHLGNYIAQELIKYGHQDGANEKNNYGNRRYQTLNDTLNVNKTGTPGLKAPNHWQPLNITTRRDQAGNPVKSIQTALSPEWGDVDPFALGDTNKTIKTRQRNGNKYEVYLDPGPPPYIDTSAPGCLDSEYKWGFCMVSVWQSHLDPADTTMWDVSPGNIGNLKDSESPDSFKHYDSFFNFYKGGGPGFGRGYDTNPVTGNPYQKQMVKRADYTRILAEYWADGIASETPPGHWFAIYNKIEDDSLFIKQWNGKGDTLTDLEYDVKAYLTLGGAMHDAAIAAWSVKGWYDYVRPVSAIRWMASQGQCSDPNKMNFDSAGIPLIPGYIKLVKKGDPLAGQNNQNVGEIKLYTWRGHFHLNDPEDDTAGVGWILASKWWPYQKKTFVTPPFPGYVSGHSTYSRAASRVMTQITGSPYFPGGMSNFKMEKNKFLEHENGPTEDVYLQYAKYKGASDYTSLSRIWGGIHPPADDLNGREIGRKVGNYAFDIANKIYNQQPPIVEAIHTNDSILSKSDVGKTLNVSIVFGRKMNTNIKPVYEYLIDKPLKNSLDRVSAQWVNDTTFKLKYDVNDASERLTDIYLEIDSAESQKGKMQKIFLAENPFVINTLRPKVKQVKPSDKVVNDSLTGKQFFITAEFSEPMDTTNSPDIQISSNNTLLKNSAGSYWDDEQTFVSVYDVVSSDEVKTNMKVTINTINDNAGNKLTTFDSTGVFSIITENPQLAEISRDSVVLNIDSMSNRAFILDLKFSKSMDTSIAPELVFSAGSSVKNALKWNDQNSQWINDTACRITYGLNKKGVEAYNSDASLTKLAGQYGNPVKQSVLGNFIDLDTKKPTIDQYRPSTSVISTQNIDSTDFLVNIKYSEAMRPGKKPVVKLKGNQDLAGIIEYDIFTKSKWVDSQTFAAGFKVFDTSTTINNLDLEVNFAMDRVGNEQDLEKEKDFISLDTERPEVLSLTANTYNISDLTRSFELYSLYNQQMDTTVDPKMKFVPDSVFGKAFVLDSNQSYWISRSAHQKTYKVKETQFSQKDINLIQANGTDRAGNKMDTLNKRDFFSVNLTSRPENTTKSGEKLMNFFPNPLDKDKNKLGLKLNKKLHEVKLKIYKPTGRKVFSDYRSKMVKGIYPLNVQEIQESGIYFITIDSNEITRDFKLIVVD